MLPRKVLLSWRKIYFLYIYKKWDWYSTNEKIKHVRDNILFFFRLINVAFVTVHVSKTLNAILNFIIVIITRYKGIDNECPKCTYS